LAIGIGGQDKPLQRFAQLLDLSYRVELLSLQVDRLLRVTDEFVRLFGAGVKWSTIPIGWEGSLPRTCLRPR